MILPQGWTLHAHETLGSTNDEAKRLAAAGAAEGAVVWAKNQTAGRGRHGNNWVSLPGNLFVTFVFRPKKDAAQLSFVSAVALAEALGHPDISLKWPNDLLLQGRKLAGILLEAAEGWVVTGIGVNLAEAPEGAARVEGTPESVLERLAAHLYRWNDIWRTEGFAPVRQAWLQRAGGLGAPVVARLANERIQGIFENLDENGALVLKLPDGACRTITSGEIYAA